MKRRPWWQSFQVLAYVVAGLTAGGTAIIVASRFLTLPERVEAGEAKNAQQDEALNKLTAIQDTWQKIYQQQQHAPNAAAAPPGLREWDEDYQSYVCCDTMDREWCFTQHLWYRCD